MIKPNLRFAHIDCLRAIAALLVIWMHTSERFVLIAAPSIQDRLHDVAQFLDVGRIGVVIFFAISGFVIPSSLRADRPGTCREFLIKRLFRLYPIYWFSIPLGLVACWYLWGTEISSAAILWNLTMVQEAMGYPSVQGQYWTLQTELFFYAFCVLLFMGGLLRSAVTLCVLIAVLSACGLAFLVMNSLHSANESRMLPLMALHLGVMFWGALFRMWYDRTAMPLIARLAVFGYAITWLVLLGCAVLYYLLISADMKILHFFIPYALAVSLFIGLAIYGKLKPAWLVWLGTISYSLYLFHPVVFYTLSWAVQTSSIEWIKHWHTGAYMLVSLVGTIAISAVTYRYIEQPAMRLGAWMAGGRRKDRVAEPATAGPIIAPSLDDTPTA